MQWHENRYLPLRAKFIILFCLLITIPFIISGIVTYYKYSLNVEQRAGTYTAQIMDQIRINLDRYAKEMERLTLTPLYDENVLSILRAHDGYHQNQRYLTTDETQKMNLFISSLSFDRSEINSILIFANDGSLFSNLDDSVGKHWTLESTNWMEPVIKKDGGLTIVPPHQAAYYKYKQDDVVSLARVIREPYTNSPLGIVKVDLTPKGFNKILSSVTLGDNSKVYIMDEEGQLLFSTAEEEPSSLVDTAILVNDDSFLSAVVESDYTGLKVIGLIPLHDLRKEAKELTSFTLLISLISLTLAYMIAVISSNRLVKPIRHLQSKMKLVQRGSLNERAEVTTRDEIGQLTRVFNNMIEEIDRLVKEVYETTLREKEAELSALQNQINPHFLYNTLETMNMLALQHNNFELSSMITSLGKLLRYTVDKQEKPVHLKDEILFVEAYLKIQSFRLGNKLNVKIHIDPSFDSCLVPKLILQPLIENVIEHGISSKLQVNLILSAKVEDEDLIIAIQDDGLGMSKPKMDWLENQLEHPRPIYMATEANAPGFGEVNKGFALRNVHQRIRLLYGEHYGLYFDKTIKQGARFWIKLPIQWED